MVTSSAFSILHIARACRWLTVLTSAAAVALLAVTSALAGTGIAQFRIDRGAGGELAWTLFYPSEASVGFTNFGAYEVAGLVDAKMKPGKFPLIVISHGSSVGMLSHHDTASYLALSGFVVAAVEHAGDNYRDSSGVGKISTVYRRAREVSDVIDAVLEGPYGQAVDHQRIGVVGYSAGTVTALMLAGAEPDFAALADYCDRVEFPIALCQGGGRLLADADVEESVKDPRIGAALLLAPIGTVFRDETIQLDVPIGIVAAESDRELPIDDHAYTFGRRLPSALLLDVIPLAGHSVFLAPCSDALKAIEAEICLDPPFVDRQREHMLLNSLALSFFYHSFDSKLRNHGRIP